MSLTTSEMTPADIAACTGNSNNNGWGFGGDGAWWIIILLLFGWGGRGFGNGFGGYDGGGNGCGCNPCATQADLAAGFNNSAVLSNLNDLALGQANIQQTLCQGFNGVNTTTLQGFNGLSREISDCCCQTQSAIDGVRYDMATQACETRNIIQNTTRDIIDNANANSRAILDFLTTDKINTLTAENQALRFQASQTAQNAYISATQDAQTAELIRRLGRDCPVPAYVVPNPNCCYQPFSFNNCGCNNGCGSF